MSYDRREQLKDASDGSPPLRRASCNRFVARFKVLPGRCWRFCSGRTCCWRGEEKVTVWSVTTTEQTGHFEPTPLPPPHHWPQNEAFKWHLFHSAALSRFKSLPVRRALIFCRPIEVLRPQRLKESRGLSGRELGPLGGTFIYRFALRRSAISHLCSLAVLARPSRTEWTWLAEIVNTCK